LLDDHKRCLDYAFRFGYSTRRYRRTFYPASNPKLVSKQWFSCHLPYHPGNERHRCTVFPHLPYHVRGEPYEKASSRLLNRHLLCATFHQCGAIPAFDVDDNITANSFNFTQRIASGILAKVSSKATHHQTDRTYSRYVPNSIDGTGLIVPGYPYRNPNLPHYRVR